MTRDFITTRKIFAKIDREADLYVVCERIREAISDIDDKLERFDERLHALEQEKVKFTTESGVHRILKEAVADEAIDWGKWAVRGTLAAAGTAIVGWLLNLAWKGFHT